MGLKQDVDEINARYCKWIISFQLDSISCYAVWGTDLTDGENDKFWIDDQQRILLFREPEQLINALLQPSVSAFDTATMSNWASRIKGHAHLAVDVLYVLNL